MKVGSVLKLLVGAAGAAAIQTRDRTTFGDLWAQNQDAENQTQSSFVQPEESSSIFNADTQGKDGSANLDNKGNKNNIVTGSNNKIENVVINIDANATPDQINAIFEAKKGSVDLLQAKFIKSFNDKDIETVKYILSSSKVDVNYILDQIYTPLTDSIFHGNKELANELLKYKGTDVNKEDATGKTPLVVALYVDNVEIMKKLLDRDDIVVSVPQKNIAEKVSDKTLHAILNYFWIKNVDIQFTCQNQPVPPEALERVPDLKDDAGDIDYHRFFYEGFSVPAVKFNAIKFLLEIRPRLIKKKSGRDGTWLHIGCGDYWHSPRCSELDDLVTETVRYLLENGIEYSEDRDGERPANYAATNGYFGALKVIVGHIGAEKVLKARGYCGRNLLHCAVGNFYKNTEYWNEYRTTAAKNITEYLLEHGVDKNEKDNDGRTPYEYGMYLCDQEPTPEHLRCEPDSSEDSDEPTPEPTPEVSEVLELLKP